MSHTFAILSICLLFSGLAQAATIQGHRRSALERLEEGTAIRNRLLLRGGRFQAAPVLGFTLNDAFRQTALYGVQLSYHLDDDWALGLTGFGAVAWDTDLAERVANERPEKTKKGSFADLSYMASLDLTYTPIIGKFVLFGRQAFQYDMHGVLGLGVAQLVGDSQTETSAFSPVLGIGARVFLNSWMSVNLEFRDYIYSAALNSVPKQTAEGKEEKSATSEINNNFAMALGLGFYFPQTPTLEK